MFRTTVRRSIRVILWGSVLIVLSVCALLFLSLPNPDGTYRIKGLSAPVHIEFDHYGIPRIIAETREDALRALGFVTARDRLFQMDLLRRGTAGRLAEVLGPELLDTDRWHRALGFERVARSALEKLPREQRLALDAYVEGINQAMADMAVPPFEFLLLGYRPRPWRPEDSLLAVLAMHENLNWTGDQERMATVMEAALPSGVFAFFTPRSDRYTDSVLYGGVPKPSGSAVPGEELAGLLRSGAGQTGMVSPFRPPIGSNGWVVAPHKTWDGRAMIANDMHLALRVPNLWYRAELHYGDTEVAGITLPGIPVMIAGSNRKIAWGFTNIQGDFVDLVSLDVDPGDPNVYRTPDGPKRLVPRAETLGVKGAADEPMTVRDSIWGPVLQETLLGKPVAVRWAALDPVATDLSLMDLERASNVHDALAVFNRAGGPPLNAFAADAEGGIAWTYTGKIPKRFGFDGLASRSWADGSRGWQGYIAPEELPRIVNPPSGMIVNANQRMLDGRYPFAIGHDFEGGYRAYRIAGRLADMEGITERDLLNLQLDTRSEFYGYYQQLALAVLGTASGNGQLSAIRRSLKGWDGFAERDSQGIAILVEFRALLAQEVLSPFMARCRTLDPAFQYSWSYLDEPLQRLLDAKLPELLPNRERYPDWNAFLLAVLRQAAERAGIRQDRPEPVRWGAVNPVDMAHPFSESMSWLGNWLNMPREPVSGCLECVRLYASGVGASERLVVAPGRENTGILHMPGGQSGHPLSPHYRDQQPDWVNGLPSPLLTGKARHRMTLVPDRS
jgi:penicillin amidase